MTTEQVTTWVGETRSAAALPEHEWDRRALDWPLTPESVVVEVGGYKGRWALQIAERYQPRLFVFEPQPWAADVCRSVLGDAAMVLPYGLGDEDGIFSMGEWDTDGCSFVKPGGGQGKMYEIRDVFDVLDITERIDLMLMNIEGFEYRLIPYMFDRGIYPARLMVQFHDFADPDGARRRRVAQYTDKYYRLLWDYGVLTAWEKT